MQINIHDAETSLSALLDKAIAGEDVVIARAGKPLVPVTAVASKNGVRLEGMQPGGQDDQRFSRADIG